VEYGPIPHPKIPDDPLLRRHRQPFHERVGLPALSSSSPPDLTPLPPMAKFSHLSRPRRTEFKPQPFSEPHQISISPSPDITTSDISDAEYLISRVSGACATKAAYTTRSEVTTYLRQTGFTGTPYACSFCGLWHVTTMPKKAQKLLMRRLRAAKKLLNPIAFSQ